MGSVKVFLNQRILLAGEFKDCSEEEMKALYKDLMTPERNMLRPRAEKVVEYLGANVITVREAMDELQLSFLAEAATRYINSLS